MRSEYALATGASSLVPSYSMHEISSEWDMSVFERARELERRIDKTFYEITAPMFRDLLKTYSADGQKVVDVGCGLGYLSEFISEMGYTVTGIDVSGMSIAYASKRFPAIRFYHTSIIEFADRYPGGFDVCIANMVLHNLLDLDASLRSIGKLLTRNGTLLVAIPHPSFWFQTRTFASRYDFDYEEERVFKIPFQIRNGRIHESLVTYVHRPVEVYTRAFENSGFTVAQKIETASPSLPPVTDLLFWVCNK